LDELFSFLSIHGLPFGLNGGDAIRRRWCFSHRNILFIVVIVVISAIVLLIEVNQIDVSLTFLQRAVAGEVSLLSTVEAGVSTSMPIGV
jgi:hypothetical protein